MGLATCFYQSDEAGVDALEGRGIDETAIAEAAEAGTFELPRHQIIATGEVTVGIVLVCSAFQAFFTRQMARCSRSTVMVVE